MSLWDTHFNKKNLKISLSASVDTNACLMQDGASAPWQCSNIFVLYVITICISILCWFACPTIAHWLFIRMLGFNIWILSIAIVDMILTGSCLTLKVYGQLVSVVYGETLKAIYQIFRCVRASLWEAVFVRRSVRNALFRTHTSDKVCFVLQYIVKTDICEKRLSCAVHLKIEPL